MKTKETIAQYCVDSKGDKDLAEQIASQFERAGFEKIYFFDADMPEGNNFVYVYERGRGGYSITACTQRSKEQSNLTETTLSELTKMVDELVGDEYQIVREFIDMQFAGYSDDWRNGLLELFKASRAKHPVTLNELKEFWAFHKGIEVDKIVVKEEAI